MSRRLFPLLPVLLAAVALPVSPALAGEDDDDSGSARLHASSHGCVSGHRAKAWVTGEDIDNVAFFVDGKRVKTVRRPNSADRYRFSMGCGRLSVGAHRARAVVRFEDSSSRERRTLRFQITRVRRTSPRFTG